MKNIKNPQNKSFESRWTKENWTQKCQIIFCEQASEILTIDNNTGNLLRRYCRYHEWEKSGKYVDIF